MLQFPFFFISFPFVVLIYTLCIHVSRCVCGIHIILYVNKNICMLKKKLGNKLKIRYLQEDSALVYENGKRILHHYIHIIIPNGTYIINKVFVLYVQIRYTVHAKASWKLKFFHTYCGLKNCKKFLQIRCFNLYAEKI